MKPTLMRCPAHKSNKEDKELHVMLTQERINVLPREADIDGSYKDVP